MSQKARLAAVAALTVAAFALRLAGIDQSLFGDEILTYGIATERTPWDTFGELDAETNPPLFFLLAWLAVQVGDPTESVRLPSLILGTATVPLVYALGLRTMGRSAAIVASAIVAISPFTIFYGIDSRAYATLTFLSALSTLALLRALRQGGALSWLAYGVCTAAVLYTHYTGVFVVLAQLGWALWTHRDRWRQLALVHCGVAFAYVPWLPSFFGQRDRASVAAAESADVFPLSVETITDMVAHVLPGYPFVPLRDFPGRPMTAIVWVTIGVALVAAMVGVQRRRRAGRPAAPPPTFVLLVALTLVTPLGLVLYSAQPDTSLLFPRNLSASVPAFALLVGWFLTSLRPWFALPAVALVLAALIVGTAKTLDDDYRRAPYRQVAHFLDDVAGPRDAVLTNSELFLGLYFERKHRVFHARASNVSAWEQAARGGQVFLVREQGFPVVGVPPLGGPENRVPLRGERLYPGRFPLAVGRYTGEVDGRIERRKGHPAITWSLAGDVAISPDAARGFIDTVSVSGRLLTVRGWATDGAGRQGADWVLAFSGRRLLAVGRPRTLRPDVAKVYGRGAIVSGYMLTTQTARANKLADFSRLRVFAVVGDLASELVVSRNARRAGVRAAPQ